MASAAGEDNVIPFSDEELLKIYQSKNGDIRQFLKDMKANKLDHGKRRKALKRVIEISEGKHEESKSAIVPDEHLLEIFKDGRVKEFLNNIDEEDYTREQKIYALNRFWTLFCTEDASEVEIKTSTNDSIEITHIADLDEEEEELLRLEKKKKKDIENLYTERPLGFDKKDTPKLRLIVKEYLKIHEEVKTKKEVNLFVQKMRKKYKCSLGNAWVLHTYREMLKEGIVPEISGIDKVFRSKASKSTSGVIVITVLTSPHPVTGKTIKPFSCKFDCHYCPNEPGQPRSYLMTEPAVLRANRCGFDPVFQFYDRARTYVANGHPLSKIELLVLGGTWTSYPKEYQEEFIRDLYYAANTVFDENRYIAPRKKLSMEEEQKINESTLCRIIGLTLETRPDQICKKELQRYRWFGVTRMQIGVQHINDDILRKINRRCLTKHTKNAIKLLKDACFKVDIHLMPDLPGSDYMEDMRMFMEVLSDPTLQVDQWKIYPCSVLPWTKIMEWRESREYYPYAETIATRKDGTKYNPLFELIMAVMTMVHPWIRINRIIRDIPDEYIIGGNNITNMRQYLDQEMVKRKLKCKDIRSREVRGRDIDLDSVVLVVRTYEASDGIEKFISFETPDEEIIVGFLRLRITRTPCVVAFPELVGCAMIRELHVYGQVVATYASKHGNEVQHHGFGSKLLKEAERISLEHKYKKISVISGNGVKNYYRKRGFKDSGDFLIKEL